MSLIDTSPVIWPWNNSFYNRFFYLVQKPPPSQWARASSITRFLDHTQRRHTTPTTDIHTLDGIQWLSHRSGRQPKTYVKSEAAITVFEFLMMGGVSLETC